MSAPSIEIHSFIPLAVLGASLLGSAHCIGMCGGLAISAGRDPRSITLYHLGRLSAYLWLGLMGGTLGAATLGSNSFTLVSWASSILLAIGFIALGINLWRGKGAHLFTLPSGWLKIIHGATGGNPFSIGAFSALLPCGWLHGFVLAAISTLNPLRGALLLGVFWLGTVPALSFSPWIFRRLLQPLSIRLPKATALLLISAGIASLGLRTRPLLATPDPENRVKVQQSEHQSCH